MKTLLRFLMLLFTVGVMTRFAAAAPSAIQIDWTANFGGSDADLAYDVIPTHEGGYLAVGVRSQGNFQELYAVKTDSEGQLSWEQSFNIGNYSETAYTAQEVYDGDNPAGYVVIGSVNLPGTVDYRPWLIRLDANGYVLWSTENSLSQQVTVDSAIVRGLAKPNGTFVIVGGSNTFTNIQDPWVAIADANGNLLNFTQFPPLSSVYGQGTYINDIVATPDGGFALTGTSSPPNLGEAFLWKFNATAQPEWVQLYAGAGFRVAQGVKVTTDGGFVLAGCDLPNCGRAMVVKTTALGDVQWTQTYEPADTYGQGQDIIQRLDGTYVLSQISFSAVGATTFSSQLVELDMNGVPLTVTDVTLGNTSAVLKRLRLTYDGNGFIATGYRGTNADPNHLDVYLVKGTFVAPNQPPVSVPDNYAAAINQSLHSNGSGVLSNDHDPEGHSLTVTLVNAPRHGTLHMTPDGNFVYIPNPDFSGLDSFTYQAGDGELFSEETTVNLAVTAAAHQTIFLPFLQK